MVDRVTNQRLCDFIQDLTGYGGDAHDQISRLIRHERKIALITLNLAVHGTQDFVSLLTPIVTVKDKSTVLQFSVDPAKAITCYQYIGYRVEKVQCLFENARCLHLEIAPWDIDLSYGSQTKEYKEAQYCSLSEHCATVKNIFCDAYSRSKGYQWSYLLREKCSIDCCSSNRCNSGRYGGKPKESEIPKYDHKRITHSWDGYRNYKTMTTTTRKPTPRYYEKGSFDTPVVISGRFAKFAIGIGISVVLFVIIVALKCAKGLKRTTRKTRSSKTSTQLTGYNRGERV